MDRVRAFAWGYFVLFIAVVAVGYVPGFHDADGNLFGLFKLDLYDDSLHLASGLWAGIAAWYSSPERGGGPPQAVEGGRAQRGGNAARLYFRLFGPLYFLDGVLGLITGSGYLDGGIFLYGPLDLSLTTRFFANLPHLIIGGLAIWVGYSSPSYSSPSLLGEGDRAQRGGGAGEGDRAQRGGGVSSTEDPTA